jgi:oligoribonuclease
MLVFLDLETTGLDVEHDDILEVACLVIDDGLVAEVARYHAIVMACREFYALPEVVRDMHTKSGLWAEATDPTAKPLLVVDQELAAFLREHAVKINEDRTTLVRPQLAGNGIHFDRGFLRRCLPRSEAELHYRQLDVTSVNELARRFSPLLFEARPRPPASAHRAMADVEESLAVARHYAAHFQKKERKQDDG